MPYTVAYEDAGIKRHEFDGYVRLLEKRGIDWTNIPRVQEPGTTNRWLYVWTDRHDADAFCADLRAETRDKKWVVRELPADTEPSPGPLTPVVILMRRHSQGAEFTLHPQSRMLVKRRFPDARPVASVSIESTTMQDFEQQHGPIWEHIALVLTGLSTAQLAELGGYEVVDVHREQTVNKTPLAHRA